MTEPLFLLGMATICVGLVVLVWVGQEILIERGKLRTGSDDPGSELEVYSGSTYADSATSGLEVGAGGENDEPVLVGTVVGPHAREMAREALADAGIPALVKPRREARGADVWVMPELAEATHDILIGIGLIEPAPGEEPATILPRKRPPLTGTPRRRRR